MVIIYLYLRQTSIVGLEWQLMASSGLCGSYAYQDETDEEEGSNLGNLATSADRPGSQTFPSEERLFTALLWEPTAPIIQVVSLP